MPGAISDLARLEFRCGTAAFVGDTGHGAQAQEQKQGRADGTCCVWGFKKGESYLQVAQWRLWFTRTGEPPCPGSSPEAKSACTCCGGEDFQILEGKLPPHFSFFLRFFFVFFRFRVFFLVAGPSFY